MDINRFSIFSAAIVLVFAITSPGVSLAATTVTGSPEAKVQNAPKTRLAIRIGIGIGIGPAMVIIRRGARRYDGPPPGYYERRRLRQRRILQRKRALRRQRARSRRRVIRKRRTTSRKRMLQKPASAALASRANRRAKKRTARRTAKKVVSRTRIPNEEIARIQRALKAQGFKIAKIDGISGPRTRAAITAFQHSLDDKATGKLTVNQTALLLDKTGSERKRAARQPAGPLPGRKDGGASGKDHNSSGSASFSPTSTTNEDQSRPERGRVEPPRVRGIEYVRRFQTNATSKEPVYEIKCIGDAYRYRYSKCGSDWCLTDPAKSTAGLMGFSLKRLARWRCIGG